MNRLGKHPFHWHNRCSDHDCAMKSHHKHCSRFALNSSMNCSDWNLWLRYSCGEHLNQNKQSKLQQSARHRQILNQQLITKANIQYQRLAYHHNIPVFGMDWSLDSKLSSSDLLHPYHLKRDRVAASLASTCRSPTAMDEHVPHDLGQTWWQSSLKIPDIVVELLVCVRWQNVRSWPWRFLVTKRHHPSRKTETELK